MADYTAGSLISGVDRAATMTGDYIDTVIDHADTAYTTAISLLNNLNAFASFTPVSVDVDWEEVNLTAQTLSLGNLPVKPTLGDIPSPAINFDFTETPYVSTIVDSLKSKLLSLLTGSSGIDDVEDEIYARESERNARNREDTIQRIAARWSMNNLSLPDGPLAGQATWADIEYQNKDIDKSRTIAEASHKTAVDNMQLALEKGISLEEVLGRFNIEYNRYKIDAAKSILEAGIQIFDALIKEKLAKVDLYKSEAQAYEANASALAAVANVDISYYNAKTQYNTAKASVAIKQIEMLIEELKLQTTLATTIATSTTQIAGQLASGSLSALHAGATIGYQGGDSNSYSHSQSEAENSASGVYTYYHHNISE